MEYFTVALRPESSDQGLGRSVPCAVGPGKDPTLRTGRGSFAGTIVPPRASGRISPEVPAPQAACPAVLPRHVGPPSGNQTLRPSWSQQRQKRALFGAATSRFCGIASAVLQAITTLCPAVIPASLPIKRTRFNRLVQSSAPGPTPPRRPRTVRADPRAIDTAIRTGPR